MIVYLFPNALVEVEFFQRSLCFIGSDKTQNRIYICMEADGLRLHACMH